MDISQSVRDYLENESSRDISALRKTLSEDFVFESPFNAAGTSSLVEGPDVFCGYLAKYIAPDAGWYSEWEFYDIEIHPTCDGETVFAEWKSRAKIASTGASYGNIYVGVFKVRDGLITLLREYRDPNRVVAALNGGAAA